MYTTILIITFIFSLFFFVLGILSNNHGIAVFGLFSSATLFLIISIQLFDSGFTMKIGENQTVNTTTNVTTTSDIYEDQKNIWSNGTAFMFLGFAVVLFALMGTAYVYGG